ncbi:hemagglutinin repeat-containing protein [Pseudoteredinibacter isoporae]|nr:hemagglutinin repeat-containing protein [Pseudoteredinibacter isoporae]
MADPIVDPKAPIEFRPTVHQSSNGTSVVDITAPSEAGVSLNQYERFDVNEKGLVLNNSLVDGESNLAGFLAANPNLSSRSANLIVNEVTGNVGSALLGQIEVFGDKASVIIANPYGIACNGCGFINTDSVALTTGRPLLTGGQLDLDISGNASVSVGELGLSGDVSALSLISGKIDLNGTTVVTGELNLVAGDMLYDYSQRAVKQGRGGNSEPLYAIDASQLGAMRAGSINIIVEGENAGVRLMGYANAERGNLNIDADGNVSLRGTAAAGGITIDSKAAVRQEKDFSAGQDINIHSKSLFVADGGAIQTAESLNVNVLDAAAIYGDTQVRGAATISAAGGITLGEEFLVGRGVNLQSEGTVTFAEGIFSAPSFNIQSAATETLAGATLRIDESLSIDGGNIDFAEGSYVIADGASLQFNNNDLFNSGAQILGRSFSASGNIGLNEQAGIIQTDQLALEFSDRFSNAGSITTEQFDTIRSPVFENLATGRISAPSIDVDGFFSNAGTLSNEGDLALHARDGLVSTGTIISSGLLSLNSEALLQLGGTIQASEAITAFSASGGIAINNLDLITAGDWNLDANGNDIQINNLQAQAAGTQWRAANIRLGGSVNVQTSELNIDINGAFDNTGAFTGFENLLLSSASFSNSGVLTAGGQISIDSASFDNQGSINAPTLILDVDTLSNSGSLSSNVLDVTLQTALNNSAGNIQVLDQFTLNSPGLINDGGLIVAGNFTGNINGDISNVVGVIEAKQQLILSGGSLNNQQGQISLSSGSISISGEIDNSGGQFRGANYRLSGGSYLSDSDSLLYATDSLGGTFFGEFNNQGLVYAINSIDLNAASLTNDSLIYSSSNALNVSGLLTNAGDIHGDTLNLYAGELINESNATLFAKDSATVSAGTLTNDSWISAINSLTVNAGTLNNNATIGGILLPLTVGNEELTGNGVLLVDSLSVNGGTINNAGSLLAESSGAIHIANLLDNQGEIFAADLLLSRITEDQLQSSPDIRRVISQSGLADINNRGRILSSTLQTNVGHINNESLIQADDITLLQANSVHNASDARLMSQTANLDISGELLNEGLIFAETALTLKAGELNNTTLINAGTADIAIEGVLDNSGSIIAATENAANSIQAHTLINTQDAVIRSASNLSLDVTGTGSGAGLINSGVIVSDRSIDLAGGDIRNNADAVLIALENINGLALSGDIDNAGRIAAGDVDTQSGSLTLGANNITNQSSGLIYSAGDIDIQAGGLLQNLSDGNDSGTVFAEKALSVSADRIENQWQISSIDVNIDVVDTLDNSGSIVSTDLLLKAGSLTNQSTGLISAVNSIDAAVDSMAQNSGQIIAASGLDFSSDALNNGGEMSAETIELMVNAEISNSGNILASTSLELNATSLDNDANGKIHASENATLELTGILSNAGELYAGDQLQISALRLINTGAIRAGDIGLTLNAPPSNEPSVNNSGSIAAESGWNAAGLGGGSIEISTQGDVLNSGVVAAERFNLHARSLENIDGTLSSSGRMNIDLQETLLNQQSSNGGVIQAADVLELTASDIDNQAYLLGLADINITATSLLNSGSINGGANITATLSENIINTGAFIAKQNATLLASSLTVDGVNSDIGFIQAGEIELTVPTIEVGQQGVLLSDSQLTINALNTLANAGHIQSGATEWLATGIGSEVNNSGFILAESLTVENLERYHSVAGLLDAQGDITLDLSALSDSRISLEQGAQMVSRAGHLLLAANTISNDSSLIDGVGALTIRTDTYENLGNAAINGGDVHLEVRRLVNTGIIGGNLLGGVGLEEVINDGGVISADGISWDLKLLQNNGGRIDSTADISIITDVFENSGGDVYANSGSIGLTVNNSFSNTSNIVASGALSISADSLSNRGLLAGGSVSLFGRDIDQYGNLQSSGSVSLTAQNELYFAVGSLSQAASLTASGRSISNFGTIAGSGSAIFNTGQGDFNNNADILFAGVTVNAGSIVNTGLIQSNGNDSFNADTINNSGFIYGGNSTVQARSLLRNLGVISSANDLTITAPELINRGGYLAGANLTLNASNTVDNSGGVLYATSGALSVDTQELILAAFQTTQNLSESETVDLVTASDSGKADAVSDIANQLEQDLAATSDQAEQDALIAAASSAIQAELPGISEAEQSALTMLLSQQGDNPDNSVEVVQESLLYSAGELNLNVGSDLKVEGDISSVQAATITVAGGIEQQGRIASGSNLTINLAGDFNSDRSALTTLNSGGDVFVSPTGTQLNDRVYTASRQNLELNGANNISLIDSSLQAGNNLSVNNSADAELMLSGNQARLYAAGNLDLSSGIKSIHIDAINDKNNIEVRNANIKLSGDFNNSGHVKSTGTFNMDVGGDLNLASGSMLHGSTLDLTLTQQPDFSQETIKADTLLTLRLPEFSLASGETLRMDGAVHIFADGNISNSGQIISRNAGIHLGAQNISNHAGATLVASGSINGAASSTASNSGYIGSLSSIAWTGGFGGFNASSGTIASKGSIFLGGGDRAVNDGIIHAENHVTLQANDLSVNLGVIQADSVTFDGRSGANQGLVSVSGIGGITFVGFSQDAQDNSNPPEINGPGNVNTGPSGDTPDGLGNHGEEDTTPATANNDNQSGAGTAGSVNTRNGGAIDDADIRARRDLIGIDQLRQLALSGDIDDALASQLLNGPVSGSLASTTTRPAAPSALDLDQLFAGISVNSQPAPDDDNDQSTLPSQPNPLADPATLTAEQRIAATEVIVQVSDEDFAEALAAGSPQGATAGSFWDTSDLENRLAQLHSRQLRSNGQPNENTNPAFNNIQVDPDEFAQNIRRLLAQGFFNDSIYDYAQAYFNGSSPTPVENDSKDQNDSTHLLTYGQLIDPDSGTLLANGTFINSGETETQAHTRFVLNDQQLLGEVAQETLDFLQDLPSSEEESESTDVARNTLAALGIEFKPDEDGKMDLSGRSIAGRGLDNLQITEDEDGNLFIAVADQRRGISLGNMAGLFSPNLDGTYTDANGNRVSKEAFQAQVAENNPHLFGSSGADDAENRSAYFNSILARADANSLNNIAAGGVTIVGGRDAEGNYTQLAGNFINTGSIDTDNLTVMAQGVVLGDNSSINTRGDFYLDVKNDIDLGVGQHLNIGNNFIAKTDGDIKLQAERIESNHTRGGVTVEEVNHRLASLNVGGNLLWDAGNNVLLSGATLNVGGAAQIKAANDVRIEAVANSQSETEKRKNFEETFSSLTHEGSRLSALGDISVIAGNNLDVIGSNIVAGNSDIQSNISLAASGNMTIASVTDENYHYRFHKKKKSFGRSKTYTEESLDSKNISSNVIATGNVFINSAIDNEGKVGITKSNNVSIVGSNVGAGGRTIVAAQNNVEILSAIEQFGSYKQKKKSGFLGISKSSNSNLQTQARHVESRVVSGFDTQVLAGNDLNLRASNVAAKNDVELRAGILNESGTLTLNAGTNTDYNKKVSYKKRTGLIVTGNGIAVSAAQERGQETLSNTAVGSTVTGGGDGTLVAAQDVNVIGSLVEVGGKIRINAGRDVNIVDKAQSLTSTDWANEKTSGISFSADRNSVGAFIGKESEKNKTTTTNSVNAPSALQAGDDVVIQSGRDINQVGSIVNAGKDALYIAKNDINIAPSINTNTQESTYESSRSGLGVNIQHNLGNTLDAIQNIGGGDNAVSQASSVLAAVDAITSFTQGPSASVHIGNSRSTEHSISSQENAQNSQIKAAGNVVLKADGDANLAAVDINAGNTIAVAANDINILAADQQYNNDVDSESTSSGFLLRGGGNQASIGVSYNQSTAESNQNGGRAAVSNFSATNISLDAKNDLLIEGANLSAANDIKLVAANDISINSAQNNSSSSTDSNSVNGGMGLAVTVGQGGASVGYYVEAGFSKNDLDRESSSYQNASINAGGNLIVNSGNDTSIIGANLEGDNVDIDVGGDFTLASQQDTATADGQRMDASVSATVGFGFSLSGSVGYGETEGNKNWVQNQTSIIGRQSVDVDVAGHTQLDGSLIANIDENGIDQGNLDLTTSSIGFSNFEGSDQETSSYLNISGGYSNQGSSGTSSAGTGNGTRSGGGITQEGSTSWGVNGYHNERDREQITRATVGQGNITVTGGEGSGEEELANLNRDIDQAQVLLKDEESETTLYVTSSSIDAVSNPSQTLDQWKTGLSNYGSNTLEAIQSLDRAADLGGLVIDAFAEHGLAGGFGAALDSAATKAAGWQFIKYHPELLAKLIDNNATAEEKEEAYQAYTDILSDITRTEQELDVDVIISEIDAKGATDGQGDIYINHGEGGTSVSDDSEVIGGLAHETAHNSDDRSESNADYIGRKAEETFEQELELAGIELGGHSESAQQEWLEQNRNSELVINNTRDFMNEDASNLRFYDEAGHYYTTFFVGLQVGLDGEVAATLARFSQLPDEVNNLDAFSNRVRSAAADIAESFGVEDNSSNVEEQMLTIYNRLHSLTGGDAVAMREEISQRIIVAETSEEKGLLIHLLGDSYAHTRLDDPAKLYGGADDTHNLGHGLDGTAPDQIHQRPELFEAYVENLAQVLAVDAPTPLSADTLQQTQDTLIGAVNNAVENSYINVDDEGYSVGPEGDDGHFVFSDGAAAKQTVQNIRDLVLGAVGENSSSLVDSPESNTLDHWRENNNDRLKDIGNYIDNATNVRDENKRRLEIQISNELTEAVKKVINSGAESEIKK